MSISKYPDNGYFQKCLAFKAIWFRWRCTETFKNRSICQTYIDMRRGWSTQMLLQGRIGISFIINIKRQRKSNITSTICNWTVRASLLRNWSISIGGGSEQIGCGSLDFEPSQRGGSLNFELVKGGGSSYLWFNDFTILQVKKWTICWNKNYRTQKLAVCFVI